MAQKEALFAPRIAKTKKNRKETMPIGNMRGMLLSRQLTAIFMPGNILSARNGRSARIVRIARSGLSWGRSLAMIPTYAMMTMKPSMAFQGSLQ